MRWLTCWFYGHHYTVEPLLWGEYAMVYGRQCSRCGKIPVEERVVLRWGRIALISHLVTG